MQDELKYKIESILFAAGDTVKVDRISLVLGVPAEDVYAAGRELEKEYMDEGRGIRVLWIDDKMQMCSAPENAELIVKVLEHRKPPKLSVPALETLSVVAYFQPVTRAYIDNVRGVDSSYTLSVLVEKGLVEKSGTLNVPGRPSLYKTTDNFLRIMDISSLDELPELPDMSSSEGVEELQKKIEAMKEAEAEPEQISLEDPAIQEENNPDVDSENAMDNINEIQESEETTEEFDNPEESSPED